MRVLTVYAHHDPRSFCHAVLERFTAGLTTGGHASEVVDLHAIKFDPVFRGRDMASYIDADVPPAVLEQMDPRQRVLDGCRGPVQQWLASRALRGKSPQQVAGFIRGHMPKDARPQQEKVASADGLAIIAPVHFCNFPAILHGWIERVFTYGFAYGLTEAAWHGDVTGRRPLLHHKRALIMTSTLSDEAAYDAGIRDAKDKVIDEWTFRYPGIENVEHVYFYAAAAAPAETIQRYLEQASVGLRLRQGRGDINRVAAEVTCHVPRLRRAHASATPAGLQSCRLDHRPAETRHGTATPSTSTQNSVAPASAAP